MRLKHIKGAEEVIKQGKYIIEYPEEYKGKWDTVFQNKNPIYLEIGTGKGDFLIQNACCYPYVNFIGIEKYDSVLIRAIQKSNELELSNLKFIKMDARKIEEIFDKEIDLIYLNFSDPWPKDRHAKRRLTSPIFLERYQPIFKGIKHIIMKTDNKDLFQYSLDSLKEFGYHIQYYTTDLYQSDRLENNIATEYEKKFVSWGVSICYLDAIMDKEKDKNE